MLVDGHEDTLRTLARVVGIFDCQPILAQSLAQARQLLDEGGVDLVICDIHLPDGSGLDLGRTLLPMGIPAVALSGSGMPQDIRDSTDAGFLEHLVKPVRFEQIEAVLNPGLTKH